MLLHLQKTVRRLPPRSDSRLANLLPCTRAANHCLYCGLVSYMTARRSAAHHQVEAAGTAGGGRAPDRLSTVLARCALPGNGPTRHFWRDVDAGDDHRACSVSPSRSVAATRLRGALPRQDTVNQRVARARVQSPAAPRGDSGEEGCHRAVVRRPLALSLRCSSGHARAAANVRAGWPASQRADRRAESL